MTPLNSDNQHPHGEVRRSHRKFIAFTSAAALFASGAISPVNATIDNTATASGTYGGSGYTSNTSSVSVPVAAAAPALTVSKTAGVPTTSAGTDTTITDAGDTITYTYVVTNTGNVTLSGVTPVDTGPTFNGAAGTGTLGAYSPAPVTLAPGASQTFTAVYTLTQVDVDHAAGAPAGVVNSASATAKDTNNNTVDTSTPSTTSTTIAAGPKLSIAKSYAITTDNGTTGKADVGDVVTYTYTIVNTGNVPLTNVSVSDTHAGVALPATSFTSETLVSDGPIGGSSDTTASNGVWSTLAPGATITIKYVHTVTQAEVDHG